MYRALGLFSNLLFQILTQQCVLNSSLNNSPPPKMNTSFTTGTIVKI